MESGVDDSRLTKTSQLFEYSGHSKDHLGLFTSEMAKLVLWSSWSFSARMLLHYFYTDAQLIVLVGLFEYPHERQPKTDSPMSNSPYSLFTLFDPPSLADHDVRRTNSDGGGGGGGGGGEQREWPEQTPNYTQHLIFWPFSTGGEIRGTESFMYIAGLLAPSLVPPSHSSSSSFLLPHLSSSPISSSSTTTPHPTSNPLLSLLKD